MIPFALIALGLFFVFSAVAPRKVLTQGTITLEPGTRYRLVVLIPPAVVDLLGIAEATLRTTFEQGGARDAVVLSKTSAGWTVSAIVKPPAATQVTIGQSLLGGAVLQSVEVL